MPPLLSFFWTKRDVRCYLLGKRYGENGWEGGAGWRLMMLSVRDDGVSAGVLGGLSSHGPPEGLNAP